MREARIPVERADMMKVIFGNLDENINLMRDEFKVVISAENGAIAVSGEDSDVENCLKVLGSLKKLCEKGEIITRQGVRVLVEAIKDGLEVELSDLTAVIAITSRGKQIRAKTYGQKKYVDAIKRSGIVFGVGPAGTGKTYLAVAMAVMAYKNKDVDKIILTRPAVEAGEKLGFLPGDIGAKVDPYLRPLYDALQEMFGQETYAKLMERGIIEIAPLAYMRGRTLSNAFIILDEAQNTTSEQMLMFLTRMGENSRVVVTGDLTQIDLPYDKKSGLLEAINILRGIEGIEIVRLTARDVVRHELVVRIVNAYEAFKGNRGGK